ncbi:MAG: AgmX/PglI C-terminal domain-containing protein [Polyangiales bacterium]
MTVGCGASEASLPAPRTVNEAREEATAQSQPDPTPKPATKKKKKVNPSERAEAEERKVAVSGIEGTLSNYDVRTTLDKRGKEFASCYTPRARHVPALGGSVQFTIHVLKSGQVRDVHTLASDLGDRVLERCLGEVIRGAQFPSPHGGEADVQYQMALEPAENMRTEQWETRRVESVLRKRRSALLSTCDAHRTGPFTVTAYVSRSGRVLAAGVSAPTVTSGDTLDCIAEELRSWSMPRPRKAIAKVSFPLRTGA